MQLQTWTWTSASLICLVEGHIPQQQWAENMTDELPPPGTPTICVRCGAVLQAEIEIP